MMGEYTLETRLSFGDETAGRVILRGHDLFHLAEDRSYEAVAAILWDEVVPASITPGTLGVAREAVFDSLRRFEPLIAGRPAGEGVRLLLAACPADLADTALGAVASVGIAAALAIRSAASEAWAAPDPTRGHSVDLLALATGVSPPDRLARAFERYCILMIDHGISASTHAARIAASTGAGFQGAMLAALSVLQGPRHGGAPALVLDQLDAIGRPGDVAAFVADARSAGRRIMGFGSRAYRGEDLRGAMMRREWEAIGGESGRRVQAVAIERAFVSALANATPERELKANVEYYAALLLEAAGLPRAGFTPMFAAARAAGWVAHVAEQRESRRMLRPISRYVGEDAR